MSLDRRDSMREVYPSQSYHRNARTTANNQAERQGEYQSPLFGTTMPWQGSQSRVPNERHLPETRPSRPGSDARDHPSRGPVPCDKDYDWYDGYGQRVRVRDI